MLLGILAKSFEYRKPPKLHLMAQVAPKMILGGQSRLQKCARTNDRDWSGQKSLFSHGVLSDDTLDARVYLFAAFELSLLYQ